MNWQDTTEKREPEVAVPVVEYEQILDKIGFGRTQWSLLLISGLLTVTSIAAQMSVGIIAIASECEFDMTQTQKGIMMAACVAGVFLSTYFWGYVSDAIGRRTVLLSGMFVTNLLQLITMFITNVWLFNLTNLLMGISVGSVTAAVYTYLSEFTVPRYRPIVINYSTMFVSIAAIYTPAASWLVLSFKWSVELVPGFVFYPWRLIILTALLPGLIGALLLLFYPESPKLLLVRNRQEEAKAAIAWICWFNTGCALSNFMGCKDFTLKPEEFDENELLFGRGRPWNILRAIWRATTPLLHKPHRRNFLLSVVTVFLLFFGSNGMQIWYPEIVNRSSAADANKSSTICELLTSSFEQQLSNGTNSRIQPKDCNEVHITTTTYVDNMIIGLAFLLGFLVQGALLRPVGRKNLLVLSMLVSVLSGVLLLFVSNADAVLVLFCLFILMPGLSISIMCGAVVDLVPTYLRGKAVSICFTFGRLGLIAAAYLIGLTLESYCRTTFGVCIGAIVAGISLVYYLPI